MQQQKQITSLFIIVSLLALILGLIFGTLGSLQYLFPQALNGILNFTQIRPLHVTLVISWIFSASIAGIYYYIQIISGKGIRYKKLAYAHFLLFILTGTAILYCYISNRFGGREYLEYPPYLAIPVFLSWVLFAINFFGTLKGCFLHAPVYLYMWTTGIVFFFITYIESYLWLIPFFRDNIVRDITIQWKALGSMVGSWNMLVYGTGFYVMEKISGNTNVSRSPLTFFFYFLGLTNLMFNWGHHTYIVPASPFIRDVSYFISMTELLIVGSIILNWKRTLNDAQKNFHNISYRFLSAADYWIFLNLILAILISIPSINFYTHGTHITVAHAMGATIGINTMILLSSIFYISCAFQNKPKPDTSKSISGGFWITNISLLIFWISLLGSGIIKALNERNNIIFNDILLKIRPWFHVFSISGLGILIGLFITALPLFRVFKRFSDIH